MPAPCLSISMSLAHCHCRQMYGQITKHSHPPSGWLAPGWANACQSPTLHHTSTMHSQLTRLEPVEQAVMNWVFYDTLLHRKITLRAPSTFGVSHPLVPTFPPSTLMCPKLWLQPFSLQDTFCSQAPIAHTLHTTFSQGLKHIHAPLTCQEPLQRSHDVPVATCCTQRSGWKGLWQPHEVSIVSFML